MELPWLKNKKNQGGGGPVAEITRDPDESSPHKFQEIAYDELHDAYHRGDRGGFLDALRAFHHTLKDE